jgi:hypothetical protein
MEGVRPYGSTSNYLIGRDRSRWRSGIEHFRGVRYRDVYPGIDMLYRGQGRQIEYDFYVAPGADPSRIRMKFQGADKLKIDNDGSLIVTAGGETLRQPVPFAFQDDADREGTRVPVSYRLLAKNEVGFEVGEYDHAEILVIDPVLIATHFGGSSVDVATNVAVDTRGDVWVVGYTLSPDLPVPGDPYRPSPAANLDLFIARFSQTLAGTASLVSATYFGGGGEDRPQAIALDPFGFLLITGTTGSIDIPLAGVPAQLELKGDSDAFLLRWQLTGQGIDALWYATYLGGSNREVGTAVTADAAGRVYMVGYSIFGEEFPLAGGSLQSVNRGGYEAFLAQIDTGLGSGTLRYSTYLGGDSTDVATGVAVDRAGLVYVSRYTMSENFPSTGGAQQPGTAGRGDSFLAQIDLSRPGLDALTYATYLGGSDADLAMAMTMDTQQRLYITGYTLSPDFPVTANGWQRQLAGNSDVFLARFDFAGRPPSQALDYATYLGGGSTDVGYSLAVNAAGSVALTGYTHSADFPRIGGALQPAIGGGSDAFLVLLDPATGPVYSSYIGGPSTEVGNRIAFGPGGNVYLAGSTTSRSVSVGSGVYQPQSAGLTDAFVGRFNLCTDEASCRAQGLLEACQDEGPLFAVNSANAANSAGCTADGHGGFVCSRAVCTPPPVE